MIPTKLTVSDVEFLIGALQAASAKYRESAHLARNTEGAEGLATQFDRQVQQCGELIDKLENMEIE